MHFLNVTLRFSEVTRQKVVKSRKKSLVVNPAK